MPYELNLLQPDNAQVWHEKAGFGTGRLVASNLILTAAHTLWNTDDNTGPHLDGWLVRLAKDRSPSDWPWRRDNSVAWQAFLSVVLWVAMPTAQAAELQVQVTIAMRGAVGEMAAAFEKRSGHTIKMTIAAPGEIVAALEHGQHADVVVLTNGALAELEDKGLVRRSRVLLATSGFGLAKRSGDLVPDISTPEKLRAMLLGASKVIYNDPKVAPSGQLLLRIAESLGVAEQVKAKSQVVAAGTSVSTLAKDTSPGFVVAMSPLTEIPGHPGAMLVGPLPKALQVQSSFSAVLGARPHNEVAAQAFLQALVSAEARQAYGAAGFEVEK
jgi:molybdate transport system substrate-binding protein